MQGRLPPNVFCDLHPQQVAMFTQLNHAKTLLYVWNYGIGPEGMVYIIEGLSGHIPRPPSYERERERHPRQ